MTEKTTFPDEALRLTKQDYPEETEGGSLVSFFVNFLARAADEIVEWGISPPARDIQLRQFLPTESYLAGAVGSVLMRNAAYEWQIKAPSVRLETALTDMLNGAIANQGFGWINFIETISNDFYAQDNGMFMELIRDPGMDAASKFKDEKAPVIGIAHLDASRCMRTGNPKVPVVYTDRMGNFHKMKWYQIAFQADLPSPIEVMYGVGLCAISRVLRLSQIMRDIEIFKHEKVGGRNVGELHFVSGVSKKMISDVMDRAQEDADNKGFMRFLETPILAGLDPEKPISTASIRLASLPDNFDLDQEMKWYISGIALGFGTDYQDFAPLPSGNIGSGEQSRILHRKSRGKGPAVWMQTIQSMFHNYGVIPKPARFEFVIKDIEEEMEQAEMNKAIAELLGIMRNQDILDGPSSREWLRDSGMVSDKILDMVPKDFGSQERKGGQMMGGTGDQTIAEDVQRTKVDKKRFNILRKLIGG